MKSWEEMIQKPTFWLVLGFIVLVLFMLAYCEDADAAWYDNLAVEIAHDSNSGITEFNQGWDRVCARYQFTNASAVLCPLVGVGGTMKNDSFEFGIADELWPRWEAQITLARYRGEQYGGGSFRRLIGDGPFQAYLGLTGWVTDSPGSNSDVTFNLGMRYAFGRTNE